MLINPFCYFYLYRERLTCFSLWSSSEEGFDEDENIDFIVDKDENDANRANSDDERQKKKKRNKR